ncbi:MAG: nucleotidyltransferase family protein [Pacificimonas sp.]|nr:nucleotidyltransferase family protein [Pacificimonas sp.]
MGALLLAAGLSRRMGTSKLLEDWNGKPIIWHSASALIGVVDQVVVTLGANAASIDAALPDDPLFETLMVPDYEEGMAASLRAGMAEAARRSWDGAFVMLGDMPLVPGPLLKAMRGSRWKGRSNVTIPVRHERRGNPALWGADHFAAFQTLRGEEGGRTLLARRAIDWQPFEADTDAICFDVDTPEALERLRTMPAPRA